MDQDEPKGPVHDEPMTTDVELEAPLKTDIANRMPFSESWINKHHRAVMAWSAIGGFLTTFVLAVIAYYSWFEVKEQRNLAFKQFVIENSPSVIVFPMGEFRVKEDMVWIYWGIRNDGGYITDIESQAILFCCQAQLLNNPEKLHFISQKKFKDRLDRNRTHRITLSAEKPEELSWLKPMLTKGISELFLLLKVKYTIPPELSLSGKPTQDSTYGIFTWSPRREAFENVKVEWEETIINGLRNHGFLSED